MEDTLRGTTTAQSFHLQSLNPCFNGRYSQRLWKIKIAFTGYVLILVLMEDTLRESLPSALGVRQLGLNPCFNGRYSQRSVNGLRLLLTAESLNPCFNGRYSQSYPSFFNKSAVEVS